LRTIQTLTQDQITKLHRVIQTHLRKSFKKGGAFYEQDLYGRPGRFSWKDIRIGYKEGQRCPVCRTPLAKIKTGGTHSVLCPQCQPLP
jgi:formamidopyrimidine-DNA glycosylase